MYVYLIANCAAKTKRSASNNSCREGNDHVNATTAAVVAAAASSGIARR